MASFLHVDVQDAIAIVRLDRPPANAMTAEFFAELATVLPRLREDRVRAVVLTGTGRFFSAGLDLFEILDYDGGRFDAFTAAFDDGFTWLFEFEKPVVAAMNGHAIAGGAVLAATADFRLMTDGGGRLGLTEIQVGVPFPASALEPARFAYAGRFLPELLYRGATYEAGAAVERGLVDEIVPACDLVVRALALAGELASHNASAFSSTKRALRAEALARMRAARASGPDPAWAVWRTEETRLVMHSFRKRAVEKKS
jgi:enoyl-CoA hydratase